MPLYMSVIDTTPIDTWGCLPKPGLQIERVLVISCLCWKLEFFHEFLKARLLFQDSLKVHQSLKTKLPSDIKSS